MHTRIFNSTIEEIKSKKSNIFIGISVGIKPLNIDLARRYIAWALEHTKDNIAILIADDIAKYNYMTFSSYKENKSVKRALRDGIKHRKVIEETISKYFEGEKSRIKIIHWNDIESEEHQKKKNTICNFYDEDKNFKERIKYFLDKYAKRRGKTLYEEKEKVLSQYILSELPTLLSGIDFEDAEYKTLLYPTYTSEGLSELATNISNGVEFPELGEELDIKGKTILVETRIFK